MANMIERVAVSQNTQFAPVSTVSPEVILEVGNGNGYKAVVTVLQNDPMLQATLYIPQYEYGVYRYLVGRNSLVSEVINNIYKLFGFLDEILSFKSAFADAEEYGLQIELISCALTAMLDGDNAASAVQMACYELDV